MLKLNDSVEFSRTSAAVSPVLGSLCFLAASLVEPARAPDERAHLGKVVQSLSVGLPQERRKMRRKARIWQRFHTYLLSNLRKSGGLVMTVSLESVFSDGDLLRALSRARVAVETRGTGGGRLQWLIALEAEMDRRLAARRLRSSAASAGRAVA